MMKRLFLILLFFTSCNQESQRPTTTHFSGIAMTIGYTIIIGASLNTREQQQVSLLIQSTFEEVNAIYNKWNPQSELSQLNQLKAGIPTPISPPLEELLRLTDQIVQISEGRFDPTIEPLQQLWKEKLSAGLEPSQEEIEHIAPAIGWNKIHFDHGIFYKDHDAVRLDLGGIAKGYCVDLLVERLHQAGYSDLFVEWGGEIRASGNHPEKRPWTIFISRLEDTNPLHAIATVPLLNQSIATSGDYLQNWSLKKEGDTITYFHVFDPMTFHPLRITSQSVASASVLAPSCAIADGLATVAMMFPSLKEAQAWALEMEKRDPRIKFWLLSRHFLNAEAQRR